MHVTFGVDAPPGSAGAVRLPRDLPTDVDGALALAVELGRTHRSPGSGMTADAWTTLATLAAHDLGVARTVEPHLDAIAILAEAGVHQPNGSWGVFAAEGSGVGLEATETADGWRLNGIKPWCSLADRLDRALVTAALADGRRGLFAVDLRSDRVSVPPGEWHARGLSEIPSGPVEFADAAGEPVGEPGWYVDRSGFHWGGIGVAACWYGGAVGIARVVQAAATVKPNPFLLMHLGAIDRDLHDGRRALAEAAEACDSHAEGSRITAKRVRATVARVAEAVIGRAGHALGPAPLALDRVYAKRVADLTLYVRQHHAERDLESLGSSVAKQDAPW